MLGLGPFKKFLLIFYIGNNENPLITEDICWSLDVRYCGAQLYTKVAQSIECYFNKSLGYIPNFDSIFFKWNETIKFYIDHKRIFTLFIVGKEKRPKKRPRPEYDHCYLFRRTDHPNAYDV